MAELEFVVVFCKYIVSPASISLLSPVNAEPPELAVYNSNPATGVAVYKVTEVG